VLNRGQAFDNVNSQKENIVHTMQRRDLTRARELATELVDYQLNHGGAAFAVKSLCDLAAEAKSARHSLSTVRVYRASHQFAAR
jgi:hypothetical protein